jgi:magnesium chelatase subunit D
VADSGGDSPAAAAQAAWADALLAARLFTLDPRGTGIVLRAGAGPVRQAWLDVLQRLLGGRVVKRLPLAIRDERLLGGLDLAATLQAGRPVAQRGLLAESDGGVLLLAMAERLEPGTAARIAAAMDRGEVVVEREGVALSHPARFGVVALDEGEGDDERLRAALADRLAFRVDLNGLRAADADGDLGPDLDDEPVPVQAVEVPAPLIEALCAATVALGVDAPRAGLQALAATRAHAALHGRAVAAQEDAAAAARLVLAPRATRLPTADAAPPEQPPEPDPPPDDESGSDEPEADTAETGPLQELVLQAALAALPPDLLAQLKAGHAARRAARTAGPAGAAQKAAARGRPIGVRRAPPAAGQRLNVIATLRAAVPWQRLRRATTARPERRIEVRADDFHVTRLKQRRETTTLFAVDASGSSALQRLAEAKGAVELLLADCYVRRDKVAVIAFRGRGAELLLPPTRSLVRAKRALAGLPGGGGTPLAAALDAACAAIDAALRRGDTPVLVLLTDGRANVALDGTGGRARAEADALAAAARLAAVAEGGASLLLIDTSPLPQPAAAKLAQAMRAKYLPLPHAGVQSLGRVVRSAAGAGV